MATAIKNHVELINMSEASKEDLRFIDECTNAITKRLSVIRNGIECRVATVMYEVDDKDTMCLITLEYPLA